MKTIYMAMVFLLNARYRCSATPNPDLNININVKINDRVESPEGGSKENACDHNARLSFCIENEGFCITNKKQCDHDGGTFHHNQCGGGSSCGCCVAPQLWEEFKVTHEKDYESYEEEHIKFDKYIANKELIYQHNQHHEAGRKSYKAEMTEFGDMDLDEFQGKYLGVIPKLNNNLRTYGDKCIPYVPSDNITIPKDLNWVIRGLVTPVKRQGTCLSCWAFSAIGSMEAQYKISSGNLVNMSAQNLLDCADNKGCRVGGRPEAAFHYIDVEGIHSANDHPYTSVRNESTCDKNDTKPLYKCKGCVSIKKMDEDQLLKAVTEIGPVAAVIHVRDFRFLRHEQIIDDPECRNDYPYLNHAVLIVGYGQTLNGTKFWIVKNSWGKHWGHGGYFAIARGKNMCGIATDAMFAEGPCKMSLDSDITQEDNNITKPESPEVGFVLPPACICDYYPGGCKIIAMRLLRDRACCCYYTWGGCFGDVSKCKDPDSDQCKHPQYNKETCEQSAPYYNNQECDCGGY